MKKTIFFLGFITATLNVLVAQNSQMSDNITATPSPNSTLVANGAQTFSQTINIVLHDAAIEPGYAPVPLESMTIDDISGLPLGVSWQTNCGSSSPCTLLPKIADSIVLSGTPSIVGTYNVIISSTIYYGPGAPLPSGSFDINYQLTVFPPSQKHELVTSYLSKSVDNSNICISKCNGSASVTATHGTAPYTYKWSNGETTDVITNECQASYSVIVADSSGIKDTLSLSIEDVGMHPMVCPDTLTAFVATEFQSFSQSITFLVDSTANYNSLYYPDSLSIEDITGLPDGIHEQTSCGINSKCMFLQPSSNDLLLSGIPLTVGTYTVSISVIIYTQVFGVPYPFPLKLTYYISVFPQTQTHNLITSSHSQNVSSFGLCDGSASVTVTKGTPPYTYNWSSGATSSSISGKCSDIYIVNVSDSQGLKDSIECYIAESVQNIQQPPILYIPIDTLITNYDTCIVDYNLPIDSAFATTFTMLDSTHLSVDFEIYQGGNKIVFNALFSFDTVGIIVLNLQLNCKGTFLRMLKSTVINQAVDLQYSQIGKTQSVDHNNFALNIESLNTVENVLIYPNPFSTQTTLSIPKEVRNASIIIVDLLGTTIKTIHFSGTQIILEKGELSSGVYFVQVLTNDVVLTTKKVVIQ